MKLLEALGLNSFFWFYFLLNFEPPQYLNQIPLKPYPTYMYIHILWNLTLHKQEKPEPTSN